jgi:hypothetical protein
LGDEPGDILITETEFERITDCCDGLLAAQDSTPARVAIPWLHVLHGHPAQLAQYQGLFPGAADGERNGILKSLRRVASELRERARGGGSADQLWQANDELPTKADVLLLTHHVSSRHGGTTEDFYFGDLPRQLSDAGKKVVVAAIDHTEEEAVELCEPERDGGITQVRLTRRLSSGIEKDFRLQMKEESDRLNEPSGKQSELEQAVRQRVAREAMADGARAALRIGHQIGELVERIQPRNLVAIHEGHAWERMVFCRSRTAMPSIRCIGYHHAVLFPWHHALKRNLAPEYNPDQILAAGEVSCAALREAPGLRGLPVEVLGTIRAVADMSVNAKGGEPVCVVVPEGIPDECVLLFEFALACARAMPECRFIFRTHPVLPLQSIVGQIDGLQNRPANVELSKASIEEDYQRSLWAMYRGSGAVVQAVLAGLKPFYIARPGELNFDPLHQAGSWRETVEDVAQFAAATARDLEAEEPQRQQQCREAFEHCRRIFQPLDAGALLRVMEAEPNSEPTPGPVASRA